MKWDLTHLRVTRSQECSGYPEIFRHPRRMIILLQDLLRNLKIDNVGYFYALTRKMLIPLKLGSWFLLGKAKATKNVGIKLGLPKLPTEKVRAVVNIG